MDEWLNLALRWFHVFAAILWIGQTWLFTFMDRALQNASESPGGKLYMVHSGGFYVVEKREALQPLPAKLHWFKWEAAFTWLSGLALLILVYYRGGLLQPAEPRVSEWAAIGIGVAVLLLAWPVYDRLWLSPLARDERVGAAVSLLLIAALAWGLCRVLSGRAAYLHLGAMLGTLMAANVWDRILPAQRRMIAALEAGRPPDLALGERAKQRSKHNTFMVLPVVLIMISNHFPTATYGHAQNWLVLAGLVAVGWAAAKLLRER
jgi:uncharacterized membrane protein